MFFFSFGEGSFSLELEPESDAEADSDDSGESEEPSLLAAIFLPPLLSETPLRTDSNAMWDESDPDSEEADWVWSFRFGCFLVEEVDSESDSDSSSELDFEAGFLLLEEVLLFGGGEEGPDVLVDAEGDGVRALRFEAVFFVDLGKASGCDETSWTSFPASDSDSDSDPDADDDLLRESLLVAVDSRGWSSLLDGASSSLWASESDPLAEDDDRFLRPFLLVLFLTIVLLSIVDFTRGSSSLDELAPLSLSGS